MIAIIPARGGSESIPKKNIKELAGYPLLAYSIIAAQEVQGIKRVIVSTDIEEIADIARLYGAEVPFLRPAEYATDKSGDLEVVQHAYDWLAGHEGKGPDYVVYLRPTIPLRETKLIEQAIEKILQHDEATSLCSASEPNQPAHKLFQLKDGYFTGWFPDFPMKEYYDVPRQMLPQSYDPNGYVDIIKTSHMTAIGSFYGEKILPFETPVVPDIDNQDDWDYAEFLINKYQPKIHQILKQKFPKS